MDTKGLAEAGTARQVQRGERARGGEDGGGESWRLAVTGVKNGARDGWCGARQGERLKIYRWKCEGKENRNDKIHAWVIAVIFLHVDPRRRGMQ